MGISDIHVFPITITCLLQGTLCDTGIPCTFYGENICSVESARNQSTYFIAAKMAVPSSSFSVFKVLGILYNFGICLNMAKHSTVFHMILYLRATFDQHDSRLSPTIMCLLFVSVIS